MSSENVGSLQYIFILNIVFFRPVEPCVSVFQPIIVYSDAICLLFH